MVLQRMAAFLLATAAVWVSQAAAQADPVSPLYRLVDTAAQRLATAEPVAAAKWLHGGPITDPSRAGAVLDAVAADAAARGIDQRYVRTIFADQIDATEGIQYTRFGQWKLEPASAPTVAPDLSQSRTQIDGFNRTMVEEIAQQWNWLHSPGCAATLTDATDAVAAARTLDPLYRHALSAATRSYCWAG
ncbi:chorismate mutase [Mycolicibacterium pulveris]|uniref:Chorismate mutase n=1 Tax=Mycolicibacterium pulveris TaxID=36813 RepID=A0A7I7UM31_MYCPV|nr:chorismate mutase [Mycolicibacterium pulveris]MCV6980644.1 chorismate mutase [Mycolicibacterium pulveris]BBY82050.1 secreted chorismate mutase [Mycolicibacterium pulveris]